MGLPGFSGFVAELQVLAGAWRAFPGLAIVAGFGVLIGVGYTLRAIQRAFFASGERPVLQAGMDDLRVTAAERIGAVLLISVSIFVGIYPTLLLRIIDAGLGSAMFEALRKAGPP